MNRVYGILSSLRSDYRIHPRTLYPDNDFQRTNAMPKMRAIDAAVHVLEREGVTHAFGVPGAAINPLYSAM